MWNACRNEVPRSQLIDHAIYELDCALADIHDEAGPCPDRIEEALSTIAAQSYLDQVYAKRFREAVFNPGYDPATRFRAGEAALDLMKRQLGR